MVAAGIAVQIVSLTITLLRRVNPDLRAIAITSEELKEYRSVAVPDPDTRHARRRSGQHTRLFHNRQGPLSSGSAGFFHAMECVPNQAPTIADRRVRYLGTSVPSRRLESFSFTMSLPGFAMLRLPQCSLRSCLPAMNVDEPSEIAEFSKTLTIVSPSSTFRCARESSCNQESFSVTMPTPETNSIA